MRLDQHVMMTRGLWLCRVWLGDYARVCALSPQVADIKRLNGLTTDLQMFALMTLRIPPGRHLPSTAIANLGRSRFETSASQSRLRRVSSQESNLNNKGQDRTSAMELLRGYYGLSLSRTDREATELAMFASDNDSTEDEPFSPMSRISDAADSRRLSTLYFRTSRFDPTWETSSSLPDSSWLINSSEPPTAAASGLLTKSSISLGVGNRIGEIKLVTEADLPTKERPIRRRTRGGFGNDEMVDVSEIVNFRERSRGKDSSVKSTAAALFVGKGAVEGLKSKVLHSGSSSTVQEVGKPPPGPLPVSTRSSSVLEGIATQMCRRGKAAVY